MIIEKLLGNINDFDGDERTVEKVILDRERLQKPHQKVTSETGETFALSLPHGENLSAGSVIYADEERIVIVDLAPEDALVIRPLGEVEWARAAYNIGNMHHMAYIQSDCIVTPYDAVLESVMQKLGVACVRQECAIDGIRASVSQQPHTHEHGHDHTHDHEAEHAHEHDAAHAHGGHSHE